MQWKNMYLIITATVSYRQARASWHKNQKYARTFILKYLFWGPKELRTGMFYVVFHSTKVHKNLRYKKHSRPREVLHGCVFSSLSKFGTRILESIRENTQSRKILCGSMKFCAAACFRSCFSIYYPGFWKM